MNTEFIASPDVIKQIRLFYEEDSYAFSERFTVSARTIRLWEAGQLIPSGDNLEVYRNLFIEMVS